VLPKNKWADNYSIDTPHNQLIRKLKNEYPWLCNQGFRKHIERAFPNHFEHDELISYTVMIPDAFWIAAKRKLIRCFEIVDCNAVNKRKRQQYGDLWLYLDGECIDLELQVHYIDGRVAEADLVTWFYDRGVAYGT